MALHAHRPIYIENSLFMIVITLQYFTTKNNIYFLYKILLQTQLKLLKNEIHTPIYNYNIYSGLINNQNR